MLELVHGASDWLLQATGISYLWLKYIHILSAFLLFGTGLGTAFHFWSSHRTGDPRAIAVAARNTVWADWLFTTPAVIIQPVSGILLAVFAGIALDAAWLVWTGVLYLLAGACWIPVVWLQMQLRALAVAARDTGTALSPRYHRYAKIWFCLGWPAFGAMLVILQLMLFKAVPSL